MYMGLCTRVQCPQMPEEGINPGVGIKGGCEPPLMGAVN